MQRALLRRVFLPTALLALLLLTNAVILGVTSVQSPEATAVEWLRLAAALALMFVLPGIAWLQALDWFQTRDGIERIVLIGGLSTAITSIAMLGAVYYPQPLDLAQTLIALDMVTLVGLALSSYRRRAKGQPDLSSQPAPTGWTWPVPKELIALLAILAVAAFLRWYTLGYGEFHEDEIENMRLAVRAMKGEEYAPFLDSKGPIHWLLPAAIWLTHGWINEALARIPFALCSTLTVLATYMLGRRMAGPAVGIIGSAFVAVNGLLVAYARHVENPSLIVFWAVLAAWCAYRFYEMRSAPSRASPLAKIGDYRSIVLIAGWLFLGIGLVAHPNMILYVPPFVFMVALAFKQSRPLWQQSWKAMAVGIGLFLALSAAFYIPFVLDPDFKYTIEYFAEERIGTRFLYNQVADLLQQESEYSSRFYTPLLVLSSALALFMALRRSDGDPSHTKNAKSQKEYRESFAFFPKGLLHERTWLAVLLAIALLTTVFWPSLWIWGPLNGAFIPFALLLGAIALSRSASFEFKSLVLWFGIPYLALTFFARDAATHIRNVHPYWALLAGIGFLAYWNHLPSDSDVALSEAKGLYLVSTRFFASLRMTAWGRIARIATVTVLGACLGLILRYEHLEYLGTVAAYWEAEANAKYAPSSLYRTVYGSLPRPRKLVSNPRLGGWKVIGALYDSGQLRGDFRTVQESFAVPIWYTHQTPRSCFDDPQNYFVAQDARGLPDEFYQLPSRGYGITRLVMVDDQPRLYMFQKGVSTASEPVMYNLDEYRDSFDRSATPERFTQEPPAQHSLQVTFGGKLLLRGYDVNMVQLRPGETLALTLHWQAVSSMSARYRAFVHVETDRMWGQHDDDPVCRLRTDEWRPPQAGMGQFRVRLDPAIPPGSYPVTVGVYNPDTGERLEAVNEQGQTLGSALELTRITVQ
jgi:4-amino-4-deoxy-L-arabinose transferase-like glycosyltransferase